MNRLTWAGSVSGATDMYLIDVGSAAGLSNLFSFDTGNGATTFAAAAPLGTYYVRVRARNACGASAPSNETVVVVGGGCATLSAPTNLNATVSGTTVTLAWNAAAGSPAGYILEVGSSAGTSNLAQLDLGSGTSVSATAAVGTYYARVRARNACSVGPSSNEVIVQVR